MYYIMVWIEAISLFLCCEMYLEGRSQIVLVCNMKVRQNGVVMRETMM